MRKGAFFYAVVIGFFAVMFPANANSQDRKVLVAYRALGIVHYYLDFPSSTDDLVRYVKHKENRNLKTYAQTWNTTRVLFTDNRENDLQKTLQAIVKNCKGPNLTPKADKLLDEWQDCRGTVEALYFFASDDEDRRILERFKGMPMSLLENIFVRSGADSGDWVANRPNKKRWTQFVDTLHFFDLTSTGREGMKNVFLSERSPDTRSSMLDPNLSLPPTLVKRLHLQVTK